MQQLSYFDYLRWMDQQNARQQPPPPPQPANVPILAQVANRTAADLFNVLPNQRAILVDSDAPFVYVKYRDADNHLLPLEVYDLVKHIDKPVEPTVNLDGYVKYDDVVRLISDEVEKKVTEVFTIPKKKEEEK